MKVGNLGLGLGAEKKDVSDLASLVFVVFDVEVAADDVDDSDEEKGSLLTAIGFVDVAEPTAGFFDPDARTLVFAVSSFRFFGLMSG